MYAVAVTRSALSMAPAAVVKNMLSKTRLDIRAQVNKDPEINPGLICIEAGLVVEGRIGNTDDGG